MFNEASAQLKSNTTASLSVAPLFCMSFPVVKLYLAIALSVAEAGQVTLPHNNVSRSVWLDNVPVMAHQEVVPDGTSYKLFHVISPTYLHCIIEPLVCSSISLQSSQSAQGVQGSQSFPSAQGAQVISVSAIRFIQLTSPTYLHCT
jgi:hypothetical protein